MPENPQLHTNMSVANLMNYWPEVVPVLLRRHMACAGCNMSSFETVGEAAKIYGVPPEMFLEELRQVIQPAR